jgi:hypothetical protein
MVQFFQQFSGINMVLQYSYYFSIDDNINQFNVRFFMGILNMFVTLISIYFMKVLNRKPLMQAGFVIA